MIAEDKRRFLKEWRSDGLMRKREKRRRRKCETDGKNQVFGWMGTTETPDWVIAQ